MSAPDNPIGKPRGLWADFLTAAAFFTRLPINPPIHDAWSLAGSAWAFPLVGAGIGLVAALTFFLAQLVGLGDWPTAILSVLAGLVLTGALHEDGLADAADGLLGGQDRATRLAVMRDSRHGSFGVLAIVISVLLRSAAVATIGDVIDAALALIAAHAASRAALPAVMRALPPARADGLGAAAGTPGVAGTAGAAAIGAIMTLAALGPFRGLTALSLTALVIFAVARFALRRVGGYTGDILGTIQQAGEVVMLLAASAR
jgi:adenosylcobinamide-GDP ribazoletransferase